MNEKQDKRQNGIAMLKKPLHLILLAAGVFAVSYCFRATMGVLPMIPIVTAVCFGMTYVDVSFSIKAVALTVSVLAINSVATGNLRTAFLYAGLCLLNCALFEFAARRKDRKKLCVTLHSLSAVICVALSVLLIGNPISAYAVEKRISSYASMYYPEEIDGNKTGYKLNEIEYVIDGMYYRAHQFHSDYPTEGGYISVYGSSLKGEGGVMYDGFSAIIENNLMMPKRAEIAALLRDSFPSESSIQVTQLNIARYPHGYAEQEAGGEDTGKRMSFKIRISGVQSREEFDKKSGSYLAVISASGISYNKIIFYGGNGIWTKWCIEATRSPFSGRAVTQSGVMLTGGFDFGVQLPQQ